MLRALKTLFEDGDKGRAVPGLERRHLHLAAACLMHEATRVDLDEREEERAAAAQALSSLFGLTGEVRASVLAESREKARHLTSYFGPVSVIKRDLTPAERVRLIEHLWRIAYADGRLDPYEDHYVRKIGHLLHVPNTEIVLARNRARPAR